MESWSALVFDHLEGVARARAADAAVFVPEGPLGT